jgi:hypothetical protein
LEQLHRPDDILNRGTKELSTLAAHPRGIVDELGLQVSELRFPLAALPRLQTVLVVELHQRAGGDQLVQQFRQLAAQGGAVLRQILDQQICQGFRCGPNVDIDASLAGQLADEEDQGTQPRFQASIRCAVVQLGDGLVDLA